MALRDVKRHSGVYRRRSSWTGERTGVWFATVFLPKTGKNVHVGTFKTEVKAIEAREAYIAAMAQHGITAI